LCALLFALLALPALGGEVYLRGPDERGEGLLPAAPGVPPGLENLETFTVDVYAEDFPGFAGFQIELDLPSGFYVIPSITAPVRNTTFFPQAGDANKGKTVGFYSTEYIDPFEPELGYADKTIPAEEEEEAVNPQNMVWTGHEGLTWLMTITVYYDATVGGNYTIYAYTENTAFSDADEEALSYTIVTGSVTIESGGGDGLGGGGEWDIAEGDGLLDGGSGALDTGFTQLDANCDDKVNIVDLIAIRNRLNLQEGDPTWDRAALSCDLTGDNKVNILDLIKCRNNLNKVDTVTVDRILFTDVTDPLEPVVLLDMYLGEGWDDFTTSMSNLEHKFLLNGCVLQIETFIQGLRSPFDTNVTRDIELRWESLSINGEPYDPQPAFAGPQKERLETGDFVYQDGYWAFVHTVSSPTEDAPLTLKVFRYGSQDPAVYGPTVGILCPLKLHGLQAFDPKLQGTPEAYIEYDVADQLTSARLEIAVMDGETVVDCIHHKSDQLNDWHDVLFWDGKWGDDLSGQQTPHAGEYADPGTYTVVARVFENAQASEPLSTREYTLYVVRVGITEISFAETATDRYFPLQYHLTTESEKFNGYANCWRIPAPCGEQGYEHLGAGVVWRLGDSAAPADDLLDDPATGAAREEIETWTEIFFPQPDDDGSPAGAPENDSFNYPVCYKAGSRVRILVKTGEKAWSQVEDDELTGAAGQLGYGGANQPQINLYVECSGSDMDPQTPGANLDILPDETITFDSTNFLPSTVGKGTITLEFSWKAVIDDTLVTIPGSFTTTHTVYRVLGKPQSPWIEPESPCYVDNAAPWVAAIDYAVYWAEGETTLTGVADKITQTVNEDLGLEYDANGACNYSYYSAQQPFRLANFLMYLTAAPVTNRLVTGLPASDVNCSDCASVTAAFSNVLGCSAALTQITQTHRLNKIKRIGAAAFADGLFSYHAFATQGEQGDETVYDAALRVGRPDPTVSDPPGELLPSGMPFDIIDAASFATVSFTPAQGSSANGTCTIVAVYEDNTLIDDFTVTCTAVDPNGQATFVLTSGRSGGNEGILCAAQGSTLTLHAQVQQQALETTATVRLEQGSNPFVVGDAFSFSTSFDYSEYRGSLASPDCLHWAPGRSRATIGGKYEFDLE